MISHGGLKHLSYIMNFPRCKINNAVLRNNFNKTTKKFNKFFLFYPDEVFRK